jgi:hypothetical protein
LMRPRAAAAADTSTSTGARGTFFSGIVSCLLWLRLKDVGERRALWRAGAVARRRGGMDNQPRGCNVPRALKRVFLCVF